MRQVTYELHTALQKAGEKGPYVLVGQSLGGMLVRVYAREYPKEAAGMVLVDSTHEDPRLQERSLSRDSIERAALSFPRTS